MALLPGTMSMAGLLSTDIFDLQVTEHDPDARVVTVVGEVDALAAPELSATLIAQLVDAPVVVVDLSGVRFLGSAGLAALVEASSLADREGRQLRLVCNSQTVSWALECTGLREHFILADHVPDALAISAAAPSAAPADRAQRRRAALCRAGRPELGS
ncbi:MAG TPA: STAS domain-containing protein [Pseudonocardiaceae bacterium]|nr:STAS domain-containing protein [Pseudonocardiaceae bacterium]